MESNEGDPLCTEEGRTTEDRTRPNRRGESAAAQRERRPAATQQRATATPVGTGATGALADVWVSGWERTGLDFGTSDACVVLCPPDAPPTAVLGSAWPLAILPEFRPQYRLLRTQLTAVNRVSKSRAEERERGSAIHSKQNNGACQASDNRGERPHVRKYTDSAFAACILAAICLCASAFAMAITCCWRSVQRKER